MPPHSLRAALAVSAALVTGLAAVGGPALGDQAGSGDGGGEGASDRRVATSTGGHARHTSDRQRGPIAPYVAPEDQTPLTTSVPRTTTVAAGVQYTSWRQSDARGPIEAHLVAVDLDVPGVRLDVTNPGRVAATDDVLDQVRRRGAVAGVNGDFYDIGGTGAPLGVTRSSQGLLHARASGWNQAFFLTRKGRPQLGEVDLKASLAERPAAQVTNVNSHFVLPGGIGVYTPRWGSAPGYAVTRGQRKDVRFVEVRDGRVLSNRAKPRPGRRIPGMVLVGRGDGAKALRSLGRGSRATVRWSLRGKPRLVITGSKLLIDDGRVLVVDDAEMHPRTAVGVDRDTNEVLLLVVDGRSERSRGYTMVELARMMQDLGADEALNLDGGGSSTMVGRRGGSLDVLNRPSDGSLRSVANALVVLQD